MSERNSVVNGFFHVVSNDEITELAISYLSCDYIQLGIYFYSPSAQLYQWFLMSTINSKMEYLETSSIEDFLSLGFHDLYLSTSREKLSGIYNLLLDDHSEEIYSNEKDYQEALNRNRRNAYHLILEYTSVAFHMERPNYHRGNHEVRRSYSLEEYKMYLKASHTMEMLKHAHTLRRFLEDLSEDQIVDISVVSQIVQELLGKRLEIRGSLYFKPIKTGSLDNSEYLKGLIARSPEL